MRKRILSLYILTTLLAVCQSFAAPQSTVHLKGQLKNMGSKEVRMRYDGASSMLGDSRDIIIQTDNEGNFDIVINLSQPDYYSISRNTLYLTPGDDMTVKITTSNLEAEFAGKGAQANTYMKKRLFPKGGSFLEAGAQVKADFTATKKTIDSLATIRVNELKTLDGVSKEFKILEKARIEADIINSYISYSWYSAPTKGAKSQQNPKEKMTKFIQSITPELKQRYKQISEEKFLDVAVVRDVMSYSKESEYAALFEDVTIPNKTKELFAAYEKVRELQNKVNQATVDATVAFTQTLKNQEFANELNSKITQIEKLLAGRLAPDLLLYTADGQTRKLSDFKGKNIYVDLWATWCGPCIQESPHFEKLSKEYEGKDIVFLPISTDTNKEAWLNYLKAHKKELVQYGSQDGALKEDWAILYIPRFILIDKDFKIVDAYAPRPSSKEITETINTLLQI